MNIEPEIMSILRNCTVSDNKIFINSESLPRDQYEKVDTVFKRLRGKWNRSAKAHVFPYEIAQMFSAVLESAVYPDDNPESYFYTPSDTVKEILEVLNIPDSSWVNVLEPTAGIGHIADEIPINCDLDLVEYTNLNCELLRAKGYNVTQGDFLKFETDKRYHYIVMNPPFNTPGLKTCYIDMIYRAFNLLAPNGKLAVITPTGWTYRSDKKHRGFREFLSKYLYSGWTLEKGTFKEAGTNIETRVLLLDKDSEWKTKERSGWPNWDTYTANLYMYNDEETYNKLLKSLISKDAFNAFLGELVDIVLKSWYVGIYLTDEDKDYLYETAKSVEL